MPNSDCEYRVIASYTTNGSDPLHSSWDLTPYQSAGIGTPGGTWRLIEAGANLEYAHGNIAADGTLVSSDYVEPSNVLSSGGDTRRSSPLRSSSGLQSPFISHYNYPGYITPLHATPVR